MPPGRNTTVASSSGGAIHGARRSLWATPSTFGRISVPKSTTSVNPVVNSHSHRSPYSSSNAAPATVAPPVWATVFRMRIAAIGRPTFCFIRSHAAAKWLPSFFKVSSRIGFRLRRTASAIEQGNETKTAMAALSRSTSIPQRTTNRAPPRRAL